MMSGYVLNVRNVNDALSTVMKLLGAGTNVHELGSDKSPWRKIAPRGMETFEWKGMFATEYEKPDERVLFNQVRDANPFFHFFESLWILNGSSDVAYLQRFNGNIASFSDDNISFHAPYGRRLRITQGIDQIAKAIEMLRADHDTRQVVMSIWDVKLDLGTKTKDLPCNDLVMLKVRDGKLNITVACRSNDIIWGAYGANAVQFSVLQEFIARAVGVEIGTYTQVSDSFHVYTSNEPYQRLLKAGHITDLYQLMTAMRPYPLMESTNYAQWFRQLDYFISEGAAPSGCDPFFAHVALPMLTAWKFYKMGYVVKALDTLSNDCAAYDWSTACMQWIQRRVEKKGAI